MNPNIYSGLEVVPSAKDTKHDQARSEDSIPDGLELALSTEADKQVLQPEKEVVCSTPTEMLPLEVDGTLHGNTQLLRGTTNGRPSRRKFCGLRPWVFLVLIGIGTIFVLGLAIGLGVGLSSSKNSSTPSTSAPAPLPSDSAPVKDALKIGGSLDASYYTGKGAWNRTGLAFNWQRFSTAMPGQPKGRLDLVMYYQHYSGAIRWMYRTNTSSWLRGPEGWEEVAVDARNATPISAFHETRNKTTTWDIFCKHHALLGAAIFLPDVDLLKLQTLTKPIEFASALETTLAPCGPRVQSQTPT